MTTQILFAFGIIISILGWTLISVSDLKADMKLVKYQLTSIHESINAKIIDNIITVFLGLIVGSFFFLAVQAKAEPPDFDQYGYRNPPPQQQQKSNVNSALDDLLGIFLQNGLSGAIIVCLGFWTFRTDKLNRAMQKENFDKLATISQDCSGHMASVSARLENLEREVEASKTLALMKRS